MITPTKMLAPRLIAVSFFAVLLLFIVFLPRSRAQQTSPLQITSPIAGTIINPGQTVSIAVSSPSSTTFSQVDVVAQDPIGVASSESGVPTTFSLTVPTDIACRTYMLTAFGATSSGQSAQSPTILIDVERPDMPTALSPQISSITLEALGEQFPLVLLAQFSDGSILDVTQSSYVTYSSASTSVATVDSNGMVTGGSAGSTTITATYTLNGLNSLFIIQGVVHSPGTENLGFLPPSVLDSDSLTGIPSKVIGHVDRGTPE